MGFGPTPLRPVLNRAHPHVLPAHITPARLRKRAGALRLPAGQKRGKNHPADGMPRITPRGSEAVLWSEAAFRTAPAFFGLFLHPAFQPLGGHQKPPPDLDRGKPLDLHELVHPGPADSQNVRRLRYAVHHLRHFASPFRFTWQLPSDTHTLLRRFSFRFPCRRHNP